MAAPDRAPGPSPLRSEAVALTVNSPVVHLHNLVPFTLIGVFCVIAGGLVAAVTAPAPTEHGTWAAAYLVLVGGVAQIGLGLGQAMFRARTPTCVVAVQAIGWNVGNAAVLCGTVLGVTALVDAGGALLVIALVLLGLGVSRARAGPASGGAKRYLYGYRLLILILIVSIPIGLVLARVRP